ncbi:sterol desaturase family protein [Rhodobacteraceae bacterium Araon29]
MENELYIRLSTFLILFLLFALLENYWPRRKRVYSRLSRWPTHWALTAINTLMLRALSFGLPLLAVGAAIDASQAGLGLFNQLNWPAWIEFTICIFILDLSIWVQHLITHKVPLLWRLHRVHHADVDMDVTTAIRFHPVEIALSMLLKIGLVYLIGPAALAVIIFEVLLNGTAMFNHANINIPKPIDAVLRKLIVTPDMHRIHHSKNRLEHDSNYGFALSIWDRIFGTYKEAPQDGHEKMNVGLEWQDNRTTRLRWTLWLPFGDK